MQVDAPHVPEPLEDDNFIVESMPQVSHMVIKICLWKYDLMIITLY